MWLSHRSIWVAVQSSFPIRPVSSPSDGHVIANRRSMAPRLFPSWRELAAVWASDTRWLWWSWCWHICWGISTSMLWVNARRRLALSSPSHCIPEIPTTASCVPSRMGVSLRFGWAEAVTMWCNENLHTMLNSLSSAKHTLREGGRKGGGYIEPFVKPLSIRFVSGRIHSKLLCCILRGAQITHYISVFNDGSDRVVMRV